ncbi:MAG TPA: SRPBCC family protein [Allosphingosinicella sp.]|jgi:uncharacterized protein YndB with AHSA1/START domain
MNVESPRIGAAPVRKTFRVKAPQQKAFDTFVAGMGGWWIKSHSLLASPQKDVVIEPRAGGRWYEIGEDGAEKDWGKVIEWEAPCRLLLAWQLDADWNYDPGFQTTVEVRFNAQGDETLVEFEHRDLDRFGARAAETAQGLDGGWDALLDGYRRSCEA